MKLWRISQNVNTGYDTYDSAVVAAETEEAAKMTHPSEYQDDWDGTDGQWSDWAAAADVTVEYLGEAKAEMAPGIICASFNAG